MSRRLRAALNPLSTALSRWWCSSAVRRIMTGYGPTASQRRSVGRRSMPAAATVSAEEMRARREAIDELLASDTLDDNG